MSCRCASPCGEGALYITIDQKPKGDPRALKRLRNIADNPSAALVADRYDEDWTRLGWVMLRGRAEILEDGAEHDMAQQLLRTRYPQYRRMQLAELPVIAIRIERVDELGRPFRRYLTRLCPPEQSAQRILGFQQYPPTLAPADCGRRG